MLEEDVEMGHCSGAAGLAAHSVSGSASAAAMPMPAAPKPRPVKRPSNKMAGASSTDGKQSAVQVK